jgi:hypothetical protein
MRASTGYRASYLSTGSETRVNARWLQAGFSSFAYRLAHLALPRSTVVSLLLVLFYLA